MIYTGDFQSLYLNKVAATLTVNLHLQHLQRQNECDGYNEGTLGLLLTVNIVFVNNKIKVKIIK